MTGVSVCRISMYEKALEEGDNTARGSALGKKVSGTWWLGIRRLPDRLTILQEEELKIDN